MVPFEHNGLLGLSLLNIIALLAILLSSNHLWFISEAFQAGPFGTAFFLFYQLLFFSSTVFFKGRGHLLVNFWRYSLAFLAFYRTNE
jgi:hypothetical protein